MAQLELALFPQDKTAIMRGCQPRQRASLACAFQTGQKCQAKFIVSPDQPGQVPVHPTSISGASKLQRPAGSLIVPPCCRALICGAIRD